MTLVQNLTVIIPATGAICAAASLGACVGYDDPPADITTLGRQDAERARSAAQCGPRGVIQKAGTDGTHPGDYYCRSEP